MRMLLVLALVAGCVIGEESQDDPGALASQASNKLALNKLALNKLALNKLALNGLGASAVAGGWVATDGSLAEFEAETADDRGYSDVLRYVVRCALPPEQTVRFQPVAHGNRPARDHTYYGEVGVATEWFETGVCDEGCQEWMSACLLAHVNALDISVRISLRGEHPALAPGDEELATFTDQEAAFFGNLFTGQTPLENAYACTGWTLARDAALAGQRPPNEYMQRRICGYDEARCGIHVVGQCALNPWSGLGPQACETYLGENVSGGAQGVGVYPGGCHSDLGVTGFPRTTRRYDRVVTTFLTTLPVVP